MCVNIENGIALELKVWRKTLLFKLAENVAQCNACMHHIMEYIIGNNFLMGRNSVGPLVRPVDPCCCVKEMGEREEGEGPQGRVSQNHCQINRAVFRVGFPC